MADRREEIAAAATNAIQRDGLRSVSFRQLADEVGVKSSSVHYHFPTKPDLAEALVHGYTERFEQQLKEIERTKTSLVERLDALVDVFQRVVEGQNLCLCGMMAAELTSLEPNTRKALSEFFALMETWVSRMFDQHQDELLVSLSHDQLACVFVSGLEGAILLDRVEETGSRLDAFRVLARAFTD